MDYVGQVGGRGGRKVMRKVIIFLTGILLMMSNLMSVNGENKRIGQDTNDFYSMSNFTDLNYYLFCDTAVNTNVSDIEHDYAIIGNGVDNIKEGKELYEKFKNDFIMRSNLEKNMDIVYISPDCKWTIAEKKYETDMATVGLRRQMLFYGNEKKTDIISEYSSISPVTVIKKENVYERMETQQYKKLIQLERRCYLDGYRGGLIINELGDLAVAVKVKGSDYQQLDIWDIKKDKVIWSFSLKNIQDEIWAKAIQFFGNQKEGTVIVQCGRSFYEVEYPSNKVKYLGKDMYSLCYSPDKKYIVYSSIDHEFGMGLSKDEMAETRDILPGIYLMEMETGKVAYIEINMEWYSLNNRKFLWIEKENFEKYIESNSNNQYLLKKCKWI